MKKSRNISPFKRPAKVDSESLKEKLRKKRKSEYFLSHSDIVKDDYLNFDLISKSDSETESSFKEKIPPIVVSSKFFPREYVKKTDFL